MNSNHICLSVGIILVLGLAAGCVSTKPTYLLSVSNQSAQPIRDVVIEFNGTTAVSSALIESSSQRSGERKKERMPKKYVVRWKSEEGTPVERQLDIENPLLRDFEGELYFQINDANEVKAFVLPEFNKKVSVMPWGEPAQWEGAPAIPGLTPE